MKFGSVTSKAVYALFESVVACEAEKALDASKQLLDQVFARRSFAEGDIGKSGLLRYNSLKLGEENIPYWGLLSEGATTSQAYEGFSLVLFPGPVDNDSRPRELLVCFGIGTGGVTTEEALRLSVPWVRRSARAMLKYLEVQRWLKQGSKWFVKDDLTDDKSGVPEGVIEKLGAFSDHDALWRKYGRYLPTVCVVRLDDDGVAAFLSHLLLYGKFRGWEFKRESRDVLENGLLPVLHDTWRPYPDTASLSEYLLQRRFMILQGPPGTGKTYLANEVAKALVKAKKIAGYDTIQFHSSYSYEDFVEGLRPKTGSAQQLIFEIQQGHLAVAVARAEKQGHVLVLDEVNRADLPRTLGEAIYLLEPGEERTVLLRSGRTLSMPKGLLIVGTMNTADRSTAILDYAIRRRFAFVDVWPSHQQLVAILKSTKSACAVAAVERFARIQRVFFDLASDEDLCLQPGHTYFLATTVQQLNHRMTYEVAPLLREYMQEGRLQFAKNELLTLLDEFGDVG